MRNSLLRHTLFFLSVFFASLLRADEARLANLSTRGQAGTGANTLTAGFVVGPGAGKPLLIRAVGPALASFGLADTLADPVLTLYNSSSGAVVATNDNWLTADAATTTAASAFALPSGSKDAALVTTLAPGSYTAQVTGTGGTTGLALVEVYELNATAASPRLLNLSTRAQVSAGAGLLLPGLVVAPGTGTRKLLIRAAGPALAAFGLTGTLADPVITVTASTGAVLATNDNWSTPATTTSASAALLSAAVTQSGAFAFAADSKDAALLVELPAGSYGIQVNGAANSAGLALVEVYDLTGVTLTADEDPTVLATAGNGEKIFVPSATKTYAVTAAGQTLQIPTSMVYIPAGSFTFGTGTAATTATLAAYCIGKFEVTNAEYKAFLDATGSKSYPSHWSNGTYPAGKAAHPLLYVSLTNATAYCAWVTAKTGWTASIPSAQQWEKAARGPNATTFPWGNSLDASYNSATGVFTSKCNYNGVVAAYYLYNFPNAPAIYDNKNSSYYGTATTVAKIAGYDTNGAATLFTVTASGGVNAWVNHDTYTGFIYTDIFSALNATGGTTTPVGTYANGQSAYGCYDMAGNVWEWTTTTATATNGAESGQLVNEIRGGSWYATGNSCRAIGIGEGRAASGNFNTVGFRIVMTK